MKWGEACFYARSLQTRRRHFRRGVRQYHVALPEFSVYIMYEPGTHWFQRICRQPSGLILIIRGCSRFDSQWVPLRLQPTSPQLLVYGLNIIAKPDVTIAVSF